MMARDDISQQFPRLILPSVEYRYAIINPKSIVYIKDIDTAKLM
jgi:hypothetical protein